MNDIQISDNFNLSEFQSKGNGAVKVHSKLVELLQAIRDRLGQPIVINSAYRDPEYNREVGGTEGSQHTKGTAADISLRNLDYNADDIAEIAAFEADKLGIGRENLGIGLYDTFVHIDVRGLIGYKSPAHWDNRN